MANVIIDYKYLNGVLKDHSVLCNLYWHLRYVRSFDSAARRLYYRRIRKEKLRLIASGSDPELVRLICRHLANPRNIFPLAALLSYDRASA